MPTPRDVLTPDAFAMLQAIAETGSFAAAARALQMVPSALTYRVRQIEDVLDVLLFDRSSRQARPTREGAELLREGIHYLADLDAVANRVKRVAKGWEPRFTISVDGIIDNAALLELCKAFFALDPPTVLKLRTETLSGTLEALTLGDADLAIGIVVDASSKTGLQQAPLGVLHHVYTMAPHHPLASLPEALSDEVIRRHRATSVADSVLRGEGLKVGVLANQEAITLSEIPLAIDAQIKGLGAGYLPLPVVRPYLAGGQLVAKAVERTIPVFQVSYAWQRGRHQNQGRALSWWLAQLQSPATRAALLGEASVREAPLRDAGAGPNH